MKHPIAQTLFLVLLKGQPYWLSTVLPRTGNTLVEIDFWNRPHQVHIEGLLEGAHLRRNAAHTHAKKQIEKNLRTRDRGEGMGGRG